MPSTLSSDEGISISDTDLSITQDSDTLSESSQHEKEGIFESIHNPISPPSDYETENQYPVFNGQSPLLVNSIDRSSDATKPCEHRADIVPDGRPTHMRRHVTGVTPPKVDGIDRPPAPPPPPLNDDHGEDMIEFNCDSVRPSQKNLPPVSPPKKKYRGVSTKGTLPATRIGNNLPSTNSFKSQDSEYFSTLTEAHNKIRKNADMKFYESDVETEYASVIYSDDRRFHNGHLPHKTPQRSQNDGHDHVTPNISNLTNKINTDKVMTGMPYHERIAKRQREPYDASPSGQLPSAIDGVHSSHRIDQARGLSTISSPSPKGQYHRRVNHNTCNDGAQKHRPSATGAGGPGLPSHPNHLSPNYANAENPRTPPLPPRYSTTPRRPCEPPDQLYHSNDNDANNPTIVHVRKNSGDSVSTLGTWTGGASSLCRAAGRILTERLGNEINEFTGCQRYDAEVIDPHGNYQVQEKNNSKKESSSSGMFSNILGSYSFSSASSFQSLEEETADFHEKNQAFLRESSKRNGNYKPAVDVSSMRSISPVPQRTHRPRLDSIEEAKKENRKKNGEKRGAVSKQAGVSGYGSTLNTTMKISNVRDSKPQFDCSSDESIDGDSCISSDFTSNQDGSYQGNSSSLKLDSSSEGDLSYDEDNADRDRNERTALLDFGTPPGISTHEHGSGRGGGRGNSARVGTSPRTRRGLRRNGTTPPGEREYHQMRRNKKEQRYYVTQNQRRKNNVNRHDRGRRSRKGKHRDNRHERERHSHYHRHKRYDDYSDDTSYCEEEEHRINKLLRRQRAKLLSEWKLELKEQEAAIRAEQELNRWSNRLQRWFGKQLEKFEPYKINSEQFISNLPLTIGAVALAIVTLGVVWFKFAEEMMDSCHPVHFHSSQCSFHEFPGCFYCDTSKRMYKVAFRFHTTCSVIAGIMSMLFFAKLFLARRVVIDEMNQPTTSSPAGLICMTIVCVFAGRGVIGQIMVTIAAALHFCLAIWFIYMAITYHILPDPSWYPNTVGIGISAVKIWLYYPIAGHFLMAMSLSLSFFFFPISLIRVTLNKKISAPVAWIQMSAPAVSLYALTIMAQPSFIEEHPDITQYQRVHRIVYLPTMHFLFIMAILGAISSVQSLVTRWKVFSQKKFSPAHAAFCFPALAHVNAIQAYRGAVYTFSQVEVSPKFKFAIDTYWFSTIFLSTIASIIITTRFFYMLPSWTCVDVYDEQEPPNPYETKISKFILAGDGETLRQDFVSPAVLQANETGALVRLPRQEDGKLRYRRTRRVTALGFDPIMELMEFVEERDALLDWVEKNPPRRRKRTVSVPHIEFNLGQFGTNNSGVFNVPPEMDYPGMRRDRGMRTNDGYDCYNSVV